MKIYEINNKKRYSFNCIYLWTNLINGKVYVGQAQNFYERMLKYKNGRELHRAIGRAINKYGIDNFDISVLEKDLPCNKLNEREQYWMDYYNSYDLTVGYNVCKIAGTTSGFHHSKKSRKKMSDAKIKFYKQNKDKLLVGEKNPMFGKTMSEENKKKMSERLMGNQYAKGKHWRLSEETKEKHRQSMLGKQNALGHKHTKETKQKISKANMGHTVSLETREKISKANKGKTGRAVICIDTGIIYNGISDASKTINKDASSISKCCRRKQNTAGGYRWKYID